MRDAELLVNLRAQHGSVRCTRKSTQPRDNFRLHFLVLVSIYCFGFLFLREREGEKHGFVVPPIDALIG